MEFKIGDMVVCKTPVSELDLDAIYEVTEIAGRCKETDVYSLGLKGIINRYSSFRFKLVSTTIGLTNNCISASISVEASKKYDNSVGTILLHRPNEGASKNDKEKIDLSLIPYISNLEHAKAFMVGEKKYGRYNYCKGHKASQLIAAAERHLQAWFSGESHDPIDSQHHLGSAMACCSMILRQEELGTLKDDRYKQTKEKI